MTTLTNSEKLINSLGFNTLSIYYTGIRNSRDGITTFIIDLMGEYKDPKVVIALGQLAQMLQKLNTEELKSLIRTSELEAAAALAKVGA
jgi:hypothetical protein